MRSRISWRAARAKASWLVSASLSFWKSRPAADSTSARHMSTIALADSGGAAPRSCSRAIRLITSAIGASSLALTRAWPRWSERWRHRAERLSATPAMRLAPSASTLTCSTASKIARAVSPRGTRRRCILRSWWRSFSAIESASPRTRLTSSTGRSRAGTVMRASWPSSEPPSGTNETFTSFFEIARMVVAVTRRNSSSGVVSLAIRWRP